MSLTKNRFILHEDWAVVILGLLTIAITLSGFILPVPVYNWGNRSELFSKVLSASNIQTILLQLLFVAVVAGIGSLLTGKNVQRFAVGFPLVYLLTIIALIMAGSSAMRGLNLEAVIISLSIGLLISNFLKVPEWLRASLSTELYVKVGLILLGASVIFGDILKAGTLGLVQALIVVISVWYFAYWVCKKTKGR